MKKVSILLSIYKPNLDYLKEQLVSLNNQTYSNLELIVWNDCPDAPVDISFFETHITAFSVKLYDEQCNLGYIKAFEKLVKLADGEYISFCDQDDIWEIDKVEKCVLELEATGAVAAVCDRSLIDGAGNFTCYSVKQSSKAASEVWKTGDDITARAAFRCYAAGMSILAMRETVNSFIPFSEHTGHDKWLMLCLSAAGKIAYVEKPLIRYRRYGKNVTGTLNGVECKKDYYDDRCLSSIYLIEDFEKHFPEFKDLEEMKTCGQARMNRQILKIWKYRYMIPENYMFEILLALCPEWLFKKLLKRMKC